MNHDHSHICVSVVIVNWNTKDLTINCLNSFISAEYKGKYEVWVVDNASTDGSADAIRAQFPDVNLIVSTQNIGFGAANNLAIRQAKGDYVWLLNPDTVVKSGSISTLIQFLEENPSTGAAGSKFLNPDGSLQTSCYPFPTLTRECWRLFHLDTLWAYGVYDQSKWNPVKSKEVDVLQGASLMLRKDVLDQTGMFDEDYFMYTEEVDLCYRLKKAGWHLFWVPQSEIIHFGGQSTQQAATKMFLSLYETKLLFFRKHYSPLNAQIYKMILSIASIVRLILIPLAWLQPKATKQRQIKLARNYQRLLMSIWK